MTALGVVINIWCRLPQILKNFNNKSTGMLAFVSYLMNWTRTGMRTAVVIATSTNTNYKIQFFISWFFNCTLVFQFWLYWNKEIKVHDSKKNK